MPVEFWESIKDMLLSHWEKCVEEGDYRFARKYVDKESEATEEDLENWFRIYDTYIKRFGLNPKYERILKVIRKKALLELKFVLTRDPFLHTLIAIEKENLKVLRGSGKKGTTIAKSLIPLGKWYGSHLRTSEITVEEYQNIMEEYQKEMAIIKSQNRELKRKR